MSRSVKKGPYVNKNLAKKVDEAVRSNRKQMITTWDSATSVMPDML